MVGVVLEGKAAGLPATDPQATDIADAETFMLEVLARISAGELEAIALGLAEKSGRFQAALGPAGLDHLDADGLRRILRAVFGTRRCADRLIQELGVQRLRRALADLLYAGDGVGERFSRFCRVLDGTREHAERIGMAGAGMDGTDPAGVGLAGGDTAGVDLVGIDVAGEVLHYVFPQRYWLWNRWVWNPRTETGALRLLVTEPTALRGAEPGDVYLRVGEAVAFAEATRQAAGMLGAVMPRAGEPAFITDIYLACVYTLYTYGTLRMRMTREFTRVVPEPAELMRRLLGIYRVEA